MSTQPSWVRVSPSLRGSLLSEVPTIIRESDGLYVNGQRVLEQYELYCGVVVLGLADGVVLTSRADFLTEEAGITISSETEPQEQEGLDPAPPLIPV